MSRYERQTGLISAEEQKMLAGSKVCVAGCGGLGGYSIEMLARLGVGHIRCIDPDVFEESNLNRQLLSSELNIGSSKARAAADRIVAINSSVQAEPVRACIGTENAAELLGGSHVVVDALDSIGDRKILQSVCRELGIAMVHGSIAGWYGQVCTVMPGDDSLDKLFGKGESTGIEKRLGNPSFTPALVSSIQVGEVLKILLERGDALRNKVLYIDLLHNEYEIMSLE